MGARLISLLRVIVILIALAVFVFPGFHMAVRAAHLWMPIGITDGPQNLPGSAVNIEDAVSKGPDVFVGAITEAGSEILVPPKMPYQGNMYRGIKVTILRVYSDHQLRTLPNQQLDPLLGPIGDQTSVGLFVDTNLDETQPKVGGSYIFIAPRNQAGYWELTNSALPYNHLGKDDCNYVALKLLPVTDNNITIVKKLIDRQRGIFHP